LLELIVIEGADEAVRSIAFLAGGSGRLGCDNDRLWNAEAMSTADIQGIRPMV
jgi:hypothetical protein